MTETTARSKAKADRRQALLDAAARLFAERGFTRVSLEDLGAAVGISGPAVYRHFDSKQAVLSALLVDVSRGLSEGGTVVVDEAADAHEALTRLVAFHVDFALGHPDVIRVQDRDLDSLPDADQHTVRQLQRTYVELWVDQLALIHADAPRPALRTRAHATFGLLNSTPHSGRSSASRGGDIRSLLESMATAALMA